MRSVRDWIGRSAPVHVPDGAGIPGSDTVAIDGVTERVVRLGRERLVGIQTDAVGTRRATVVWCNSGSEPHVGPGRALGRVRPGTGGSGLRVRPPRLQRLGGEPRPRHTPGRPYDAHCVEEIGSVVDDLRAQGHRRVVVAGLCAGAWVALRSALTHRFDGVVAINPQLYWQPGDPVEADIASETRVRRAEEIAHFRRWRRTGLWSALDAVGVRHPAADWLRDLGRSGTPVLALFAEGDDGLEFLRDRVGRAWAEARRHGVQLAVIPDIDHPMHRTWRRGAVVDAVRTWLDALPAPPRDTVG